MKKMNRLVALSMGLVLASSTFLSTTAFAAASKVELTTVSMFGGNDPSAKDYEGLVKAFSKQSGVDVQDSSDVANDSWKASVVTDFNTGNEPDVIFFFNGIDAKPLLPKVVDIKTIKAKYPSYAKDILPSALNSMKEADGKTYAVPVKGFWEAIYCNKDLFDKYKLELPTTWDNLIKAVKTFRANNIDPFTVSFAEEPHYLIENLILSAGGASEHSVNPGTSVAKVPASWYKGLDAFKTLGDLKAFPKDAATKKSATAQNDFYKAKAAMFVDGSWRTSGIIDAKRGDKVVVVPFPTIPGGKGTGTDVVAGFSSGFYITQKAWNDPAKQKAAVDFVNYMTTKDAVKTLMSGGAGAPAANIASDPNASLVLKSGTQVAGAAKNSDMPIDSRLQKAAWSDIWTKVGAIASGKTTAKDVLTKAIPQNK